MADDGYHHEPSNEEPASLPVASSQRYRPLLLGLSAAAVVGFGLRDERQPELQYYKHVDEVMRDPTSWQDKRLQLHGFVVPGSIAKAHRPRPPKLEYKFRVENCGSVTEARFAGVVPDTFKEGAEVVLKGQLRGDTFHTSEVMAKCPPRSMRRKAPRRAPWSPAARRGAAEKMNELARRWSQRNPPNTQLGRALRQLRAAGDAALHDLRWRRGRSGGSPRLAAIDSLGHLRRLRLRRHAVLASGMIFFAILSNDFSIKYVHHNADAACTGSTS